VHRRWKLWIGGLFVAELDPTPTQLLVDLQWVARQTGSVLGGRAKVDISDARGLEDSSVTVTVTYVDPDSRGLQRAEAGLEKLLHYVLAESCRQ
jgi:hypothetical protein